MSEDKSLIDDLVKTLTMYASEEDRVIYLYRGFLAKKCLNNEFIAFCEDVEREERLLESKRLRKEKTMTEADIIKIRTYCDNIKVTCDDFINQNPLFYDPGNNYEEIVYIGGQIDDVILILDNRREDKLND